MALNTRETGSPGWWLNALGTELTAKRARIDLLYAYATGNHPLPETTNAATRQAYVAFQRKARTNYPGLIVTAPQELLLPIGFRTAKAGDDTGDMDAWRMFQANGLDADCGIVHGTALTASEAYVIVGDVDEETGEPLITAEDPRQVVTISDPARQRKTRAALKLYADYVAGVEYGYLYVPDDEGFVIVHKVARGLPERSPLLPAGVASLNGAEMLARHEPFGVDDFEEIAEPVDLAMKVNPVVRFRNRPQVDGSCLAEFEDVIDIVDRINHETLDRLVIATMQAFRQRALKGDLPENDADGNPIDWNTILAPGADALWQLPGEVDLWESSPTDLTPIVNAAREDVRNLGAITRTPPHYLLGDYTNASAEAASLARMGLESKVYDRQREYGQSWNQVLALGFLMKGESGRANPADIETIWRPPERYSLAERADAISKMADQVPWRALMQDVYGATPTQLDRMQAEKDKADKVAADKAKEIAQAAPPPPDPNTQPEPQIAPPADPADMAA